jgi:hypothetical protein
MGRQAASAVTERNRRKDRNREEGSLTLGSGLTADDSSKAVP